MTHDLRIPLAPREVPNGSGRVVILPIEGSLQTSRGARGIHKFHRDTWSQVWRLAIIAAATLILCSCQGRVIPPHGGSGMPMPEAAMLPPGAMAGGPGMPMPPMPGPPGMENGVPLPYTPNGPWTPPGMEQPWPRDEYLTDGGNSGPPVRVTKEGEVRGLQLEDTIAHFETLDGRTLVEPSNKVFVYSPRFGAVRQVVDARVDQNRDRAAGVFMPTRALIPRTSDSVAMNGQALRPIDEVGKHPAEQMRTRATHSVMEGRIGPRTFENMFKAYENVAVIRQGVFLGSESAFLAKGVNAAVAWTHDQAVQVLLDRQAAVAATATDRLQMTYTVTASPANPRLRVIKVASTPFAEPGDEASFTIRFDNIGNQPIGNVTILDNLSTRLEYLADSAQCSVNAQFTTKPNEGESVVLRCELADPLKPGKGGVLRFRCRVR